MILWGFVGGFDWFVDILNNLYFTEINILNSDKYVGLTIQEIFELKNDIPKLSYQELLSMMINYGNKDVIFSPEFFEVNKETILEIQKNSHLLNNYWHWFMNIIKNI